MGTDVWVDGEVAHKKGKGMKEIANRMDGIKFNAVLVEGSENSWNLIYLATAVVMHKDQEVLRNLPMPPKAIRKTSSADLNPAKVKTFEQVAGKLTQKPAPEDPNELARREEQKRRMAENDKRRDAKNNVCLHPPAGHSSLPDATLNCANILKGKCPPSWEVPNGCCLSEHSKYEMLLESTPGFVCCNAPCTSLEASFKAGTKVHLFALPSVTTATGLVVSNQTVCSGNMGSTLCAPGMRRYFSNNGMGRQGGMMDMNMQLATMGMFGGGPLSGGRVIGGYGAVDVPGMGYMNVMDLNN